MSNRQKRRADKAARRATGGMATPLPSDEAVALDARVDAPFDQPFVCPCNACQVVRRAQLKYVLATLATTVAIASVRR